MIVSIATLKHPIVAMAGAVWHPRSEHGARTYDVLTTGSVEGMRRLYKDTRYLFIFLSDSATLMFDRKKNTIYQLLEYIGNQVGRRAGVVLRAPHEIEENLNDFKARFPDLFSRAIEKSIPCIFVIEQDLDQFSPDKDHWAIFKLSDLFNESGEPDARLSESFAREFTRVVNSDESVFDFLYGAQIDKNRNSLLESFQLKPGIFGFGIDLKKWLKLSMPHGQR